MLFQSARKGRDYSTGTRKVSKRGEGTVCGKREVKQRCHAGDPKRKRWEKERRQGQTDVRSEGESDRKAEVKGCEGGKERAGGGG